MEAHVPQDDALARIVSLADAEGLLEGGSLERFLEGLRERGRLILEARVVPLEAENAWRRDSMAALEQSLAEAAAAHDRLLEHHHAALAAERREAEAREEELQRARAEHGKATAAHDRLIEHHKTVIAEIAAELTNVVSWLPWSYRRAQARLSQLAETLRRPIT
jgi:septal ring factor EnvC (AmiA/AmiB activator)